MTFSGSRADKCYDSKLKDVVVKSLIHERFVSYDSMLSNPSNIGMRVHDQFSRTVSVPNRFHIFSSVFGFK